MKHIFTLFMLVLIAASGQLPQDRPLAQGHATTSDRRTALVIGNGVYTNAPPLKNPPNDATDMADALAKLGFHVARGVNLTQRHMKAMMREFGQQLKQGGHGLFYFAGHGVQLRGRNYLIPVDADIQSEADVEDQGVDANLVLSLMDEAGNALNVVILDACRNNPFARSFRSTTRGLAQMEAPSGTLIAYATAPGAVASDGEARNGLYTQELLRQLLVPGLSIEAVFKRVRIAVRQATAGTQTPWESSSLTGDLYLSGAKTTTPPSASATTTVSPSCFAKDVAGGVTDRQTHSQWANERDPATLEGALKDKIAMLFACASMDAERLSQAFARLSIIVAQYVPDAHCFGGDTGVVGTNPANHQQWGVSKGATVMHENVQWKVAAALQCMPRAQQAAFYADVSVIVATAPAP